MPPKPPPPPPPPGEPSVRHLGEISGNELAIFTQLLDSMFQLPVAVFKFVVVMLCFALLLVPVMAVALIQGRKSWEAWGLWLADRLLVLRKS